MAQFNKTTSIKTTKAAYINKSLEVGEILTDENGTKVGAGNSFSDTPYLMEVEPERANRLEVIAHRGFNSSGTQNTMQAFTSAVGSGALSFECDIQISSDGVPVIFHDLTVDYLTDGTGAVSSLSLAQLQVLKFNSTVGTIVEGAKIPKFMDLLIYCKQSGLNLYVEIKSYRTQSDIQLMINDIYTAEMQHQVFILAFSLPDLEYTRSIDSVLNLGLLGSATDRATYESLIDSVADLGRGFIYWSYGALISKPEIVTYAKDKGLDVASWTVNSNDTAKELMDLGVYKIITDIQIRVL